MEASIDQVLLEGKPFVDICKNLEEDHTKLFIFKIFTSITQVFHHLHHEDRRGVLARLGEWGEQREREHGA